ncbi:hypothetical protein [Paenibacillus apis]|uniref:hypothetical protein n=1 Tax=Paenibacillus apis TaxID=1792174 RepID=UPI00265870A6|nr:hypothetical protein [Paenibacillus apis]
MLALTFCCVLAIGPTLYMAEHKSADYESAIIIIEKRLRKLDFQGLKKPEKLRFFCCIGSNAHEKKGLSLACRKVEGLRYPF